jgi:hypothetical protein
LKDDESPFSQLSIEGDFSMTREPSREPEKSSGRHTEFRSPYNPTPRIVNRTNSLVDGFPAKLEPRRDKYLPNR